MSPEEEPSPTISEPPVSEDSEPSTEPEVVLDTDDLIEPDENLPPQEEVVSDDVPVSEEVTRREPGKEETETADLQTEPDAQVDNAGNSIGSAPGHWHPHSRGAKLHRLCRRYRQSRLLPV
ncbi:MAG: hypothetical protein GDA38_25770 [Hormoscilla sp. SP12CHS1]|nr:hypothetical protein [Hormoscilla sp. SP12CHS1]